MAGYRSSQVSSVYLTLVQLRPARRPHPSTPPPVSQLIIPSPIPGLYFAPLVAGAVAVAAFALGAGIWGCRRYRNGDAGKEPRR